MVKIATMVEDCRRGACPAVHGVDGDLTLATGEKVSSGLVLVQGYRVDDPDAVAQINLGLGEGVLAVQESLILEAADLIRARR